MYEEELKFLKENKNLILSNNFPRLLGKAKLDSLLNKVKDIFNKISIDWKSLIAIDKSKLNIQDITLLYAEEAGQVPKEIKEIRRYNNNWWLRSPGFHQDLAAYVYYTGSVNYYGCYVYGDEYAVRPALQISNLESLNLKIGDIVIINGIEWVVISDNYLLCDDNSFGRHMFDEKSNDYEKSEIKEYIHEKAREFGLI